MGEARKRNVQKNGRLGNKDDGKNRVTHEHYNKTQKKGGEERKLYFEADHLKIGWEVKPNPETQASFTYV